MPSTPASTSARHKISAPVKSSLIGSHSPEVAGVERLVFQLVRVVDLVQRVDQGARTRFDDIGRRAVSRQRFAVDARLHQHLSQAVASRRDRLNGQIHDFHLASDHLGDRCESRGDRSIAARRRAALTSPAPPPPPPPHPPPPPPRRPGPPPPPPPPPGGGGTSPGARGPPRAT